MKKRERVSKVIFLMFFLFFIFVLLQVLSPIFLPSDTYTDLSGVVGVSNNEEAIETMPFPFNFVYNSGDKLCHQKSERSCFINGNQMPFCSRCTAIWVGLAVGLFMMLFYKIELSERFIFLIFLSLVPIGVDGVGQLIGFWESSNLSRVITGLIIGVPVGFALRIIADEIKTLYKSKTS